VVRIHVMQDLGLGGGHGSVVGSSCAWRRRVARAKPPTSSAPCGATRHRPKSAKSA
jgi:hypothetical protein